MLNDKERTALIAAAQEARQAAYVPYSHYPVGAALLAKSGKTYLGANVENAAYPDSICAERVALFKAVTEGERDFIAIAVVTKGGGSPCGSCRQALAEFGLDPEVLIADASGAVVMQSTVGELLPGAFGPHNLER